MHFRPDIQALRGLAVLLVVIYHADILPLRAGYLGVDIFFVISGYLITRLIAKPDFNLAEFYWRRAKRLLPAAYATFLGTAVASLFILTDAEQRDFVHQLLGALTFTGNFVLWHQAGYFAGEAALKPLLHVWSLAIEEQYYLILPALMIAIHRRYWRSGAILLCAASFFACLAIVPSDPSAAFYLLPTRFWELAIGSIGALALHRVRIAAWVYWSSLATLFVLPFFPTGLAHPGLDAAVICVAALIVILANRSTLDRSGLGRVGDFSYSLYLVHWPIFALAGNIWLNDVPLTIRLMLLVLSFVVGVLLYRYIEAPVRRAEIIPSCRLAGTTIVATALLAFLPYASSPKGVDYVHLMRINYGFSQKCNWQEDFTPDSRCSNTDEPEIMVWGDSYAMHLVRGIATVSDHGVIQATRSLCGPVLGLAPISNDPESKFNRNWALKCLAFNDSVLAYLESTQSIKTVILSSPFVQYTDADLYTNITGKRVDVSPNIETVLEALETTTDRLESIGKNVVIVSPPPVASFHVGRCLEREASGKVLFRSCDIPLHAYRTDQADVISLLDRISVDVVRLDDFLCDEAKCKTKLGNVPIYRDEGHLSHRGSIEVARLLMANNALPAQRARAN